MEGYDFSPQLRLLPSLVNAGSRRRLGLSSIGCGVSFLPRCLAVLEGAQGSGTAHTKLQDKNPS
jgi:hypothetical protein